MTCLLAPGAAFSVLFVLAMVHLNGLFIYYLILFWGEWKLPTTRHTFLLYDLYPLKMLHLGASGNLTKDVNLHF